MHLAHNSITIQSIYVIKFHDGNIPIIMSLEVLDILSTKVFNHGVFIEVYIY